MANIKEQIIAWFNSPQDYDEGVRLLEQVSKKKKILGKLIRRGKTRASTEKLIWELNKVAGLKKIPVPKANKPILIKVAPKGNKPKKEKTIPENKKKADDGKPKFNLIGNKDLDSYPSEVKRLVKEYSSLYMLRGKKHAAIKRLPEDNSKETITDRIKIIDEIKTISDRLEVLYHAFNAYEENGVLVDVTAFWPEKQEGSTGGSGDTTPKSVKELKNLKKNIQSSITKDRNILLYSGKTKPDGGKENPLPAGPKRTKLEKRVAKKEADIKDLDQKIADLS